MTMLLMKSPAIAALGPDGSIRVAFILNEVRGLVLAAPVLYGLYISGGTPMAIYIAACSLGGIALSVIVPIIVVKKADRYLKSRVAA